MATSQLNIQPTELETDWQTTKNSVVERNKVMFNNALISDVSFVVQSGCSSTLNLSEVKSSQIPAHKYILATGSPVFFAMFYGDMAETKQIINLPDCDAESFLELLRWLYYDEVNLTGKNVMLILYLAKKYIIPSLAAKCSEFLQMNLSSENVFSVLPEAVKFAEENLIERCWEVVDNCTEESLKSEAFLDVDKSILEKLVERNSLFVKEVNLFKSVDQWAIRQCENQGLGCNGENKREIIGCDVLNQIRFPVMTQREFAETVFDCKILTMDEVGAMLKYYSLVPTSLKFKDFPREGNLKSAKLKTIRRFSKAKFGWVYIDSPHSGSYDLLDFTVGQPVYLHTVRMFGNYGCRYQVKLTLYCKSSELDDQQNYMVFLNEQEGSYLSEAVKKNGYFGYNIKFKHPVLLEEDKTYRIEAQISGPKSYYGEGGFQNVYADGVSFHFLDPFGFDEDILPGNINGTDSKIGQFVEFHYKNIKSG